MGLGVEAEKPAKARCEAKLGHRNCRNALLPLQPVRNSVRGRKLQNYDLKGDKEVRGDGCTFLQLQVAPTSPPPKNTIVRVLSYLLPEIHYLVPPTYLHISYTRRFLKKK